MGWEGEGEVVFSIGKLSFVFFVSPGGFGKGKGVFESFSPHGNIDYFSYRK